jgi:hypothetical protein
MTVTKRQTLKSLCAMGVLGTRPAAVQARVSASGLQISIKLLSKYAPVRRAVTDLAADIRRVLNIEPTFGDMPPNTDGLLVEVDTGGIGERETFRLRRTGQTIALTGADMRTCSSSPITL